MAIGMLPGGLPRNLGLWPPPGANLSTLLAMLLAGVTPGRRTAPPMPRWSMPAGLGGVGLGINPASEIGRPRPLPVGPVAGIGAIGATPGARPTQPQPPAAVRDLLRERGESTPRGFDFVREYTVASLAAAGDPWAREVLMRRAESEERWARIEGLMAELAGGGAAAPGETPSPSAGGFGYGLQE